VALTPSLWVGVPTKASMVISSMKVQDPIFGVLLSTLLDIPLHGVTDCGHLQVPQAVLPFIGKAAYQCVL